ncbi:MAG: HRDC domain-containing protein [Desulfobacterales bacterium]|nr:HRDC domain-containing protein [Desulfobacterales bacterium]
MESSQYQVISTGSELLELSGWLCGQNAIAVDLEADSMFHYQEKVCLIQMAARHRCVIVDPLRIKDLSALEPVFSNPGIKKIFHGADYDVRSLFRDFGFSINNLFDTELACRFLGNSETGLEKVLWNRFNFQHDKRYQKKDWSRRPLAAEMMEYAAADVGYLIALAKVLEKELRQSGRLSWFKEECSILSRVRAQPNNTGPMFLRVRGAGRLAPRNLAILESLLQLRDRIARSKDRPHFKVFGNEHLLKIATSHVTLLRGPEKQSVFSRKQNEMHGALIQKAIREALDMPEGALAEYPRKRSSLLKADVRMRQNSLQEWRTEKAEALQMDPSLICKKSLMAAIAQKNPKNLKELNDLEGLRKWQIKEFGGEILAAL